MPFEGFPRNTSSNQEIRKVHPEDILPSLSPERREDILEIVDFCHTCVKRYTEKFDAIPPSRNNFFLFERQHPEDPLGSYEPEFHVFGVEASMIYAPHIIIHEMLHYMSCERSERLIGYQYKEQTPEAFVLFYNAINEGVTDLIAQDIYTHNYRQLKDFFVGRGGLEYKSIPYTEEVLLVQKLIYYQSLLVSKEAGIPEEEVHAQVWNEICRGYFANDHTYLEELFAVFAQNEEERVSTIKTMRSIKTTRAHKEGCEFFIKILDKKITDLRTWLGTL